MRFSLIGGHQQGEEEIDRLKVIDGVERDWRLVVPLSPTARRIFLPVSRAGWRYHYQYR